MVVRSFSVCIPSHRNDYRLLNAVRSVREQEYPKENVEVCIFYNGVSHRGGPAADVVATDEQALGPSNAKNRALELGSNDWLVLLDSDDTLVPSALQTYNEVLDTADDLILGCELSTVNLMHSHCPYDEKDIPGTFHTGSRVEACYPNTPSLFSSFFSDAFAKGEVTGGIGRPILFKRSERLPFNPEFFFAEERELIIRYWQEGLLTHIMPTMTYVYNWNKQGITEGTDVQQSPIYQYIMERLASLSVGVRRNISVVDRKPEMLTKKDLDWLEHVLTVERGVLKWSGSYST
jgi:glycosyltransferase involved in cell wall biosynthesis